MAKKTRRKEVKVKKQVRKSKAAFVLAFISVLLLLVNGLLVILARNWLANMLATYTGTITQASTLITYGIIWLVLAVLIWITMHRIEKLQIKSEKWLLLVFSVITVLAGRIESGILALIAALLYLRQK